MLKGKTIYLKEISERDIEMLRQWRNLYRENFFSAEEITKEQQRRWYEIYRDDRQGRDYMFIIVTSDGEPCGTIALYNIELGDRSAELGRVLLLSNYRGRGIMGEAIDLLCDWAFNHMRLYRIKLSVFLDNAEAIGLYASHGFKSMPRPIMVMERKATDADVWKRPLKIGVTYDDLAGDGGFENQGTNIR